jgi:hypothetical protein
MQSKLLVAFTTIVASLGSVNAFTGRGTLPCSQSFCSSDDELYAQLYGTLSAPLPAVLSVRQPISVLRCPRTCFLMDRDAVRLFMFLVSRVSFRLYYCWLTDRIDQGKNIDVTFTDLCLSCAHSFNISLSDQAFALLAPLEVGSIEPVVWNL